MSRDEWRDLLTNQTSERRSAQTETFRFRLARSQAGTTTGFRLSIRGERAWTLQSDRTFQLVRGPVAPPYPVGCLLVVDTGSGFRYLEMRTGTHHEVRRIPGGFEYTLLVSDAHGAGLSYWRPLALPDPGDVTVAAHEVASVDEVAWLEPYEFGARAAICLTDHADHDSIEVLEPLRQLFADNAIRFTKSVFPTSDPDPSGGKREPGLDDPRFRDLISAFRDDGTEIAYHSFFPRARTPETDEARSLMKLMTSFGAVTWIDHGRATYNFAAGDTVPGLGRLSRLLEDHGVVNFWSHLDIAENPFRLRSSWQPVRLASLARDAALSTRVLATANRRALAYEALHFANNAIGVEGIVSARSRRHGALRDLLRSTRSIRQLQRRPMLVYDEGGSAAVTPSPRTRWVFDTVLLNHLAAQLRPEAIDALISDSGLLLGHCYLAATAPYMARHTTRRTTGGLDIEADFARAVAHIGERQRAKAVVTTTFTALRASLESFAAATLERSKGSWLVSRGAGTSGPVTVSHFTRARLTSCGREATRRDDERTVRRLLGQSVELRAE